MRKIVKIQAMLFSILCIMTMTSTGKSKYKKIFKKGCDHFNNKDHHRAKLEFEKTIHLNPNCFQSYYNLGLIHEHNKEYNKAIEYMIKALEINPQYPKPFINLANMYHKIGQTGEAKKYYKKALQYDDDNSQIHYHIGKIYLEEFSIEQGLDSQCIYHLEKAHKNDPQNIQILSALAYTKNIINELDDVLELYYLMNNISPNDPWTIYNIAYTLKKLGQFNDAIPYYKKTLTLRPDYAKSHFGYSLALLSIGNWQEGFSEYEWRWKHWKIFPFAHCTKPMWNGSSLHGKVIYLRAEQGLGDTFQLIRYVKIAKEMGGTTLVAVQQPLMQYMKLCPYIDILISIDDVPPSFDVYASFMSCPMILKTTLDNVPADIPYLHADEDLVNYWRTKLDRDTKFKIGICWQGSPNYGVFCLSALAAKKAMPLNYFVPLFDIPNTSFYCLQVKTGIEQLEGLSPSARAKLMVFDDDFDKAHGSFMDSAAVIKNLDLVITIDTSVGHFSAGLGTPTWVLLPEPSDWRWLLDRTDTPWYPNMKLFRQPRSGDWQSPMDAIAAELTRLLDMRL